MAKGEHMQDKRSSLIKGLKSRYIIALSLIAILSTTAFIALSTVLKEANKTAYIVNIAGKQRMLSQHIALDINQLYLHMQNSSKPNTFLIQELLSRLKHDYQLMRQTNRTLSSGLLLSGEKISLSPTIQSIYFGEVQLSKRVTLYTQLTQSISDKTTLDELNKIRLKINMLAQTLLTDLDKVAQQYQLEGEQTLATIKTMETTVWIITLLVLLLEVIFIFQPMVHQISKLTLQNTHTMENLENLVNIRTLDLERSNQKLRNLASHDPLTGLRNRLNLEQDIESSIDHYALHHAPYAVLLFDIDWFKKVNDTYGHDAGDFVLTEIANILKGSVREEDHVYRAGGEEFVILLNRVSYTDSMQIAEKIRSRVESHPFVFNQSTINQTISGGVFHSSLTEPKSIKKLLKLVDEALYCAKEHGRNCIQVVGKTCSHN